MIYLGIFMAAMGCLGAWRGERWDDWLTWFLIGLLIILFS